MYPPAIEAFPIVVGQGARMMLAGLISYGISQTLNVTIFSKLSGGSGKLVWLWGMIASIISQIIDTLLFITISFYGERPILDLMIGQMITKVVLSIILVPVLITGFVALGEAARRAGLGGVLQRKHCRVPAKAGTQGACDDLRRPGLLPSKEHWLNL